VARPARLLTALALCATLAGEASALPDCVHVRTSAPYRGLGYDHIVTIENGCPQDMTCRVTTNVNPSTIVVQVPSGKAVDVLTWRGSPARTFQATVDCAPQK
jgi:hypothetical protein